MHNRSCRSTTFSGSISDGLHRDQKMTRPRLLHHPNCQFMESRVKAKGGPCQCSLGVVMQSPRGQTSSLQGRVDTAVISRRAVPCFHALFGARRIQHEEERIESSLLPVRCSDKILNAHDSEMLSMYTCRETLTGHRKHRRFPPLMFAECICICLIQTQISKHCGQYKKTFTTHPPYLTAAPKILYVVLS